MKTYRTAEFLENAFVAVPQMKKALSFKVSGEILKYDLSLAHALIIREISRLGSPSMGELVRNLDISCAMMTHFTDQLQEKQLVRRKRSDSDRRVVNVILTKKGLNMLEKIRGAHKEKLGKLLSKFTEAERKNFIDSFETLYRLIMKYGETPDEDT